MRMLGLLGGGVREEGAAPKMFFLVPKNVFFDAYAFQIWGYYPWSILDPIKPHYVITLTKKHMMVKTSIKSC